MARARVDRFATLFVVAIAPLTAQAAERTPADRETSRALYVQGMQALEVHDYAAAERACGGAHALMPVPTSAECWALALEGLGRLVEARDAFVEALHFPVRPDEPAVFTKARLAARDEADSLAPRIPTLTLVVSGIAKESALRMTLDGEVIASETVRLPRKVNPGPHTLTVSAEGFAASSLEVTIAEGEDRHVEVALHPSSENTTRPPDTNPSLQTVHGTLPTAVLVAGGAGAIGLIVGVGAGLFGTSKHSMLSRECDAATGTCPTSAQSDLNAFHAWRTASTVGYILGAASLIAGGVVLFVVHAPRKSTAGVGVWLGPGSCGFRGRF